MYTQSQAHITCMALEPSPHTWLWSQPHIHGLEANPTYMALEPSPHTWLWSQAHIHGLEVNSPKPTLHGFKARPTYMALEPSPHYMAWKSTRPSPHYMALKPGPHTWLWSHQGNHCCLYTTRGCNDYTPMCTQSITHIYQPTTALT